ncbi:ankyrin repeat and SOCS box protein 5 isoform X3 [Puntigrus tetrazona]|uniref:ankyrin repeat and SOCS box protein 5 isoform X3 n=1 Tax=Puntigrus tetrazona TaxID=1606681 RepID=UPI001C89FAE9|nr:ankyrin repeat and SOCS box protein 5 isoform X3 [Puntigrus tetrazona]
MTETTEEYRPFAAQLSNVYLTILALFCFKLFVRITLNLLTHFYIIKGNRKEAARISAEFYDNGQGHGSWADRSALHDAASQGRLLALKTLIAQVNVTTIDGVTPLLNSCSAGSLECLELLLQSDARPQALAVCQPSPIHEAVCRGLYVLMYKGHSKCVEALIAWGVDVDYEIPHMGTPLYSACRCQEFLCVRKLLDGGANVQRGTRLESPLHAAAQKDCISVVKLLLEFGADVNARNLEYKRPVEAAPPGSLTEGFLLIYEATPRSLRQLCRQQIRESLGRSRLHLLARLPLPKAMKNFLQYR